MMLINDSGTVASKQKIDLIKSFESAKSVTLKLKAFKQMEPFFDEIDLGMECLVLAHQFYNQSHDIEQTLHFGKKALKIMLANLDNEKPCFGKYTSPTPYAHGCLHCQTPSFFISAVCNLLGKACFDIKRYDEGLSYLNWANRNFTNLLEAPDISRCVGNCVLHGLVATQFHLTGGKTIQGKNGEAAVHAKKVLEIKEKLLEQTSIELGEAYLDTSIACAAALDFITALSLCLKALEIHEKHLGSDSDVVAEIRQTLGFIYRGLGESEKALEQNDLSLGVLKDTGSRSYALLMDMGRYEEALVVLEKVVSCDGVEGEERVLAFLAMATAFVKLGKFSEAKKHMKIVKNMLEKKGTSPSLAATGFGTISCLYEELNDPETALSYMRRAAANPDLPQSILSDIASNLFSLTFRSSKLKEGIPNLEDVVKKLKDSFGPEHFQVGYGYTKVGIAYCNSGQKDTGVKFLENAKDILDATLGPNHVHSLETTQILSTTYASMGRYTQAIDLQEKVVEGLKGLGASEQEFVNEAVMLLNEIKEEAAEPHTSDTPLFEDLCETTSKCGISDSHVEINY